MSTKFNFKLLALCTILSAMLVVPALGQGKDETGELQKSGEKKTEGQVQLQKKESAKKKEEVETKGSKGPGTQDLKKKESGEKEEKIYKTRGGVTGD